MHDGTYYSSFILYTVAKATYVAYLLLSSTLTILSLCSTQIEMMAKKCAVGAARRSFLFYELYIEYTAAADTLNLFPSFHLK